MSVGSGTPYNIHTGNGVTTLFAFGFTVLDAADLSVTVGGVATSAYTVAGVGVPAGGSITFSSPPANGAEVVIALDITLQRLTDYQSNGDLLAATLNADFDRLWQALLLQADSSSRALRVPFPETLNTLPAAADRALTFLAFDSNGQPTMGTPASGSAADLALSLADGTNAAKGAGQVGFFQSGTGAAARTALSKMRDAVSINDFLPAGFSAASDATAYIQAALDSGAKVVDFLGTALKCDAVTVPAGVWAKNVNFTKFTNAAGNVVLVNTGCTVTGKIAGTGLTSAIQRAVYSAADGVCDVSLNVDVSNITVGVHAQYLTTDTDANRPKRWTGYIYAHDIVGTAGVSEGYGLLLSPAESCEFVVRAKNIRRHAVYLSAGASHNTIDADCDGCGNYALQFNSLSPQGACQDNTVTIKARNLTTDVAGQSGALAIIGRSHYNTCTVFCTGNSTTVEAVRVEGASAGVQADHPKGNKIIGGAIRGQFTSGDVIRLLNADGTHVRGNTIDAYATAAVIGMRRTGTNLSVHGGYIEGNTINAQGQSIRGVYNEINSVPSFIGENDIRNNGSGLRVDDQTGGQRLGYSRRVTFSGTTASIGAATVGDTTVTISSPVQLANRHAAQVWTTGASVDYTKPHVVLGSTAPAENQVTFRIYNAHSSAQTFNFTGYVEGD